MYQPFRSIAAISWCEQILLLTWTPTSHLEIKQSDYMHK